MAQEGHFLSKSRALIVLLTFNIFTTSNAKFTFLFKKIENKRFSNVTTTVTRNTPINCGRLCVKTPECDVFNYNPADHACEFCSFYPGDDNLMVTENGWGMYYADDDCQSSPCLNSGACTDTVGSYECTCSPGFEGSNCEIMTCLPGWTRYQSSCYRFDGTQQNFSDAVATCNQHATMSHLVYINTADENTFIMGMLQGANTGDAVWLGATLNANGGFIWIDGTAFYYTYWGQSEPDGLGNEGYVCAWTGASPPSFGWADVTPDFHFTSLCEYEIVY